MKTSAIPEIQNARQGSASIPQNLQNAPKEQALMGSRQVSQLQTYQHIANAGGAAQRQPTSQGGLPSQLMTGIESLSGIAMNDVRVHYNSSKPAQLQAHAYAQGADIHIAPGQERHLPHEAWHVVQQKQGRVKPTLQLKGVAINDDSSLEREADVMGERAMSAVQIHHPNSLGAPIHLHGSAGKARTKPVIQACGNQKYYEFIGYLSKLVQDSNLDLKEHTSASLARMSMAGDDQGDSPIEEPDFDEISEATDTSMQTSALASRVDQKQSSPPHSFPSNSTSSSSASTQPFPPSIAASSSMSVDVPNAQALSSIHSQSASSQTQAPQTAFTMDEKADHSSQWEEDDAPPPYFPSAAYIINAILPFGEINKIPEVVRTMVGGLDPDDLDRIAVVLGVNAPEDKKAQLEQAIAMGRVLIEQFPFPVVLKRATFKGKFPYGTIRNLVMQSRETKLLTQYFLYSNYHPYISFQDFDTGSRAVGADGKTHVFHAVDQILSGTWGDSSGITAPRRPLMIAGGYRPDSHDDLVKETIKRLKAKPIPGVDEKQVSEQLRNFELLIADDMRHRNMYARLDPMLPYAPEPNLFIDASASLYPSPDSETNLEFGSHGAEFSKLGKLLSQYAAEELSSYYAGQVKGGRNVVDAKQSMIVDAQNNRHPQREETFFADYENLAVVTDLSRLAYGFLAGTSPQSHQTLTTIVDRMFADKQSKTNVSLSSVANGISSDDKEQFYDMFQQHHRIIETKENQGLKFPQQEAVPNLLRQQFYKKHHRALGGLKRQAFSPALSFPLGTDSDFAGSFFGVDEKNKTMFAHQVAIQSKLPSLIQQILHQSVLSEATRIGADTQYNIGFADGTDHNCSIISVFKAANVDITRVEAQDIRRQLIQAGLAPLFGDVDLTPNCAAYLLNLVTEKTRRTYRLMSVHQAAAQQPNAAPTHAAAEIANNGGNTTIYVFFAGAHFSPATRK